MSKQIQSPPRRLGKNTRMVCDSAKNQVPIWCYTEKEKKQLQEMSHKLGVMIPVPIVMRKRETVLERYKKHLL